MSERAAIPIARSGAQRTSASLSLDDDADQQLNLRGAARAEIRTIGDFVASHVELSHREREHVAHALKIGKPRRCEEPKRDAAGSVIVGRNGKPIMVPRAPSRDELGIRVDAATGKQLIDPDDPTLRDRDCDPELYGKSPDEIAEILEAREHGDDIVGESEAFWNELMAHPVSNRSGGGDRGRKKQRPKGPSAVDQAAIHSVGFRFKQ